MTTKTFVYSIDIYHEQRIQKSLEDINDFFSPLVDVVLQENGGRGAQAEHYFDYFTRLGLHYNSLNYLSTKDKGPILVPLRTWVEDSPAQLAKLSKSEMLFPFVIVRFATICEIGKACGFEDRVYDSLDEIAQDTRIKTNDIGSDA